MILSKGPIRLDAATNPGAIYLKTGGSTLATVWGQSEMSCANAVVMAHGSALLALCHQFQAATNKADLTAAKAEADSLLARLRAEYDALRPQAGPEDAR